MTRPPRSSPLSPYTPLFRSDGARPPLRPGRLGQLGDLLSRHPDRSAGGRVDSRDQVQQRRLSRPRGTHQRLEGDRKSTRLNSSHLVISYAVFCLKKKTAEDLDAVVQQVTGDLEHLAVRIIFTTRRDLY